jgi:hypothetical protein
LSRTIHQRHHDNYYKQQPSTSLYSFMGSDGGILGIGAPELVEFSLFCFGWYSLFCDVLY